jgi:hypothetical protein
MIAIAITVAVTVTVSITIAVTVNVSITIAIAVTTTLPTPTGWNVHQFCHRHYFPLLHLHGQPPPALHCPLQHLLIVEYHCAKVAVDLDTFILALPHSSSPRSYPYTVSLERVQNKKKNHCQQWH